MFNVHTVIHGFVGLARTVHKYMYSLYKQQENYSSCGLLYAWLYLELARTVYIYRIWPYNMVMSLPITPCMHRTYVWFWPGMGHTDLRDIQYGKIRIKIRI